MNNIKKAFIKIGFIYFLIPILLLSTYFSAKIYYMNIRNETNLIKTKIIDLKSIINLNLQNKVNLLNTVSDKIKSSDNVNINEILKTTYEFYKADIEYIFFADKSGQLYIYPEISIPKNFNFKDKKWYKYALKEEFSLTNSYADIEKTKIVITISKAVFNENKKLIGVLAFDLKYDNLLKILKTFNLKENENLYIINNDGEVIFNNSNVKKMNDLIKKGLINDFGSIKENGKTFYYAKINNIYLVYQFDDKNIIKKAFIRSISYFLSFLIIIFIILYLLKRYLIKEVISPINALSKIIKDFTLNLNKQKFEGFILPTSNLQEINEISISYSKLLSSVTASITNLKMLNNQLKLMYSTNEKINKTFYNFLSLINQIDNENLNIDEYFKSVLEHLILHIKEAKYGSMSILKDNKWEYIAAVGHDINILKSLNIPVNNFDFSDFYEAVKIITYNEIFEIDKENIDTEIYNSLKKATKKFEYAMLYSSKLEGCLLLISLETPDEKGFSNESKKIFKAYANLAKIFLNKKFEMTKIENIYFKFAEKLASIAEGHDDITGKHIYRVGEISAFIAEKMGYDKNFINKIRKFAPLHDIGKVYIPYEILTKKDKLTDEEWEEMKNHPLYSKKLLSGDDYFKEALNIALYHHENCDGSGYPFGLKCDQIPIEALIVKVADIYDALRDDRPYKKAFSHEKTVQIILKGDNRTMPEHFLPEILKLFEKHNKEINNIWEKINKFGGDINEFKI
ncbi:HD domain-containing phosphohydrolase [Marinitoga sp. 1155]|uniref:HD domain-containing phosphohydrolase n=1 Tax=Marinitoga sp. 1155 TaxID=1428448 RepID=UPI00065981F9|nr:HD domain-containing phosphohydrolase [Marinitoga sp. 1155]KLO21150.1 phosphohydrolase [Marinitoga sp. 1155]